MWFQLTCAAWCACVENIFLCIPKSLIFPLKSHSVTIQPRAFGMLDVCPRCSQDPARNGWLKRCFVSFQTQFLRFLWRSSFSLWELNCRDNPYISVAALVVPACAVPNFFQAVLAGIISKWAWAGTWDPWAGSAGTCIDFPFPIYFWMHVYK